MPNGTLYFHTACFDGLVSAAITSVFLETDGWQLDDLAPVGYDRRESWLSTHLHTPAAVVDFLYHPDAEFWADHHSTTFLTPAAREDFERRRSTRCFLFDDKVGSCSRLLWDALHARVPDAERYREAVSWAEKIDTANYASVDEAIDGTSPALRIKLSLLSHSDPDYLRLLVKEMRSGDLNRIAELAPVHERFAEAQRRIAVGLSHAFHNTRLKDEIALMDIEPTGDEIVSRYAPYRFFPQARYSISIVRSASSIRITAMRNPWMNFRSAPIGKILQPFGGGGHERVGSVLVPDKSLESARKIVDCLVSEMQSYLPSESVIT
jgi:hypothetical protein